MSSRSRYWRVFAINFIIAIGIVELAVTQCQKLDWIVDSGSPLRRVFEGLKAPLTATCSRCGRLESETPFQMAEYEGRHGRFASYLCASCYREKGFPQKGRRRDLVFVPVLEPFALLFGLLIVYGLFAWGTTGVFYRLASKPRWRNVSTPGKTHQQALPFLTCAENSELIQRIELAQQDERKRHMERFGAIYCDYLNRGLSSSTACFVDQWREKIDHHERLTGIGIDQVFHLVETTDRRLAEEDETAIIEALASPFTQAMQSYAQEQERSLREHGLTGGGVAGSMNSMWNITRSQAVERIGATIRTQARDWDRKRREAKRRRRKEWLDRIPAWWPILLAIGAVIGWVGRDIIRDVVQASSKTEKVLPTRAIGLQEHGVDKPKWLDYSGQSTEELLALEGKYRTDSLVVAFDEAMRRKAARVGEERLAEEERIILVIETLERQVNNGGYNQFFFNSSRKYAPILVDALNRIGSPGTASITQEAIDALGIRGQLTVDAIDRAMGEEDEERTTRLRACDKRYFSEVGDLAPPLFEFIKANCSKIKLHN